MSDTDTAVVKSLKVLDPNVWTRRALQGKSMSWSLWSRTNVSGLVLELMLRAIMEIRARPSSLPAMPRRAIWGHQFSDVLERPFVHLLFSLADLGGKANGAFTSDLSLL